MRFYKVPIHVLGNDMVLAGLESIKVELINQS